MLSVEEEAIKKAERNSGGQHHHQRSTTPTHRTTMSIPDQSQAPVRKSSHIRLFALGIIHRLLSSLPLEWLMKSFKLHLDSRKPSIFSVAASAPFPHQLVVRSFIFFKPRTTSPRASKNFQFPSRTLSNFANMEKVIGQSDITVILKVGNLNYKLKESLVNQSLALLDGKSLQSCF